MSVRDVVFVTVDSLRADRVGFLGYDRDTTPTLDSLAAESVVFENATAHAPTTFTSFPSILTGDHAYENPEYPELAEGTVAERFRDAGYHTLSVTSNAWTSPTYGYDRGFRDVRNLGRGPRSADSRWDRIRHRIGDTLGDGVLFRVLKSAYDGVRNVTPDDRTEEDVIHDVATTHVARSEPTFTWVHYMTVHAPYTVDPERSVPYVDEIPSTDGQRTLVERAREDPESVSKSDRNLLSDLYDASVRHVDRRIADLLEAVSLDDTVVCLTADHGEAFWEHGYFEHPPALHQELLNVPLFFRKPDRTTEWVESPVGLSGIPDTLERLAGIREEGKGPLQPCGEWAGPVCSAVAHRSRFEPEHAAREHLAVAVRDGDWKLLVRPDGSDRLYDLAADPSESTDCANEHPSVVNRLSTRADEFAGSFSFGEKAEIPENLEDQLADLGYLQ